MLRFATLIPLLVPFAAVAAGVDFQREIQPLFAEFCYECHGPDAQKGGLNFTTREGAMKVLESEGEGHRAGASGEERGARAAADDGRGGRDAAEEEGEASDEGADRAFQEMDRERCGVDGALGVPAGRAACGAEGECPVLSAQCSVKARRTG